MKHPVGETIDICMEKLFVYLTRQLRSNALVEESKNKISSVDASNAKVLSHEQIYKILVKGFESYILTTHKSNHVQFVMFYFCSFKVSVSVEPTLFRGITEMSFFLAVILSRIISELLVLQSLESKRRADHSPSIR